MYAIILIKSKNSSPVSLWDVSIAHRVLWFQATERKIVAAQAGGTCIGELLGHSQDQLERERFRLENRGRTGVPEVYWTSQVLEGIANEQMHAKFFLLSSVFVLKTLSLKRREEREENEANRAWIYHVPIP